MKISNLLMLLIAAFTLNGCFSRPALRKETFLFATRPGTKATPSNGPVLALRRIAVAPQFNSTALNYRKGEFSYEQDPYAGFLVAPEESMTAPVPLRPVAGLPPIVTPGPTLAPHVALPQRLPRQVPAISDVRRIGAAGAGHEVFSRDDMRRGRMGNAEKAES